MLNPVMLCAIKMKASTGGEKVAEGKISYELSSRAKVIIKKVADSGRPGGLVVISNIALEIVMSTNTDGRERYFISVGKHQSRRVDEGRKC